MSKPYGEGYVTTRVKVSTHLIIKSLAGFNNEAMIDFIDRVMRKEAERQGFRVREVTEERVIQPQSREIEVPVAR